MSARSPDDTAGGRSSGALLTELGAWLSESQIQDVAANVSQAAGG
jgi:hypothetical protein